jgi:hypothetical protein
MISPLQTSRSALLAIACFWHDVHHLLGYSEHGELAHATEYARV